LDFIIIILAQYLALIRKAEATPIPGMRSATSDGQLPFDRRIGRIVTPGLKETPWRTLA
jgi:hypothetical protein